MNAVFFSACRNFLGTLTLLCLIQGRMGAQVNSKAIVATRDDVSISALTIEAARTPSECLSVVKRLGDEASAAFRQQIKDRALPDSGVKLIYTNIEKSRTVNA